MARLAASDDQAFVAGDRRRDPRRLLRLDHSVNRNDDHHNDGGDSGAQHNDGADSSAQHNESRSSYATDLSRFYP